jgi:hypothetical protein
MVIQQGEIWWADLDAPVGSTAGFRRPVLIVQCNSFNRSRISTTVCVPLTSNLKWDDSPTNTWLQSLPVLTSSWGGRLHKKGHSAFRTALVCHENAVNIQAEPGSRATVHTPCGIRNSTTDSA